MRIMRLCVLPLILLSGCVSGDKYGWDVVAPTSEVETALLKYTAQHAAALGLKTRGEITNERHAEQLDAAGWYDPASDTAFYYRPDVEQYVTLVDGQCPASRCELATGVAAHEVCHALYPSHDTRHWCCQVKLGVRPTYPPPVTPGGYWPVCE